MASIIEVLLVVCVFFTAVAAGTKPKSSHLIPSGSSLSQTSQPNYWLSPSRRFAFGFYPQSSGFAVGIWLVVNQEKKVVWTANRYDPPVSSDATLNLTNNGLLLLRAGQSKEKRLTTVSEPASSASMLDTGNFVLYNNASIIIWKSFDFPTNTILGGQNLTTGNELYSSVSDDDGSTGRFRLNMQYDGNLVLYPVNTTNSSADAYWATNIFGENFDLYLNYTGHLSIRNSSGIEKDTLAYGRLLSNDTVEIIYRATLDFDGIFRLYSHSFPSNDSTTVWSAMKSQCEVKGICGLNSYCTINDIEFDCRCLPGFNFINPDQKYQGCERNFTQEGCGGGSEITTILYNITTLESIQWGDNPYFVAEMTKEECDKSCLEDCSCSVALFEDGKCKKQTLPLRYVRRDTEELTTAFIKVVTIVSVESPNSNVTSSNPTPIPPEPPVVIEKGAMVLIIVICLGFFICSSVAIAVSGFYIYSHRVLRYRRLAGAGNLGLSEEFTLQLFTYNELLKATEGFKEELGRGSFGAVYKGVLCKGKKTVAVKRLEKVVEEGEREFRAEMRAIGRTHHRNLVQLIGYCAEDSKRLLVYEYMSNGSLADLLFKVERRPDWNERVRIALDVARGILYLHEECETPIIHCDIKPQNILMDDFWTAKISDFGLAKLLMPNQTRTFTGVRGTRGYLAPEWQKNTPISVKADVYSFGVVLLEIVCCRRNMEINVSASDEVVLSNWVYKCFMTRQLGKLVSGEEVDKKTLERMVKVGLWCIQDEPPLRPSMKNVIRMLEGIIDTSIPPSPSPSTSYIDM